MQARLFLIVAVFRASHGIKWLSGNRYAIGDTTCTTLHRENLIRPIDTCWKDLDKWYKLTCNSTHARKRSFSDKGCTTGESVVAAVALGTDACVQSPLEYDDEFSDYSKFECQVEHDDYVKIRQSRTDSTCVTVDFERHMALNYCVQVGAGCGSACAQAPDAKSAKTLWKWNDRKLIATYYYSDTACKTMTDPILEQQSVSEAEKCVAAVGGGTGPYFFADTAKATSYRSRIATSDGSQKFGTVAVAVSAALLGHLVAM